MDKIIRSYKDLDVWTKAVEVVKDIYDATKSYPKEEIYGLTNQMRRAAVSIPANIAEGKSRQTKKEFIQFLHVSKGSCSELETFLIISKELAFMDQKTCDNLTEKVDHISRMLMNLIKGLKGYL